LTRAAYYADLRRRTRDAWEHSEKLRDASALGRALALIDAREEKEAAWITGEGLHAADVREAQAEHRLRLAVGATPKSSIMPRRDPRRMAQCRCGSPLRVRADWPRPKCERCDPPDDECGAQVRPSYPTDHPPECECDPCYLSEIEPYGVPA
jgi:hypothetical protein